MATQQNSDITIVHTMNVCTVIGYPIANLRKLFNALRECKGYESNESKLFRESEMRGLSEKTTTDIGIVLPVGTEILAKFKKLAEIN